MVKMKDRKIALKDVNTVYDTLLIIQKKVEHNGPFPPLDDYEDYITIWAESRFLRGRNFYAARAANVRTDVEWKIRSRNDLDETMRIKVEEEGAEGYSYYEIEGILPLDHDRLFSIIKAYKVKKDM